MPSVPRLMLSALAAFLACLGSSASARSGSPSGLHDVAATDLVQATSSHGDVIDIDAVSGLDDASGLEHDGRQLTMFKAAPLLFKAGSSVLDTFLEVAAGALVDGISGSGAVPIDLGALIDDAIKEIDAVVEQSITKAFNNEKRTLLDTLSVRVTEYTRRSNLRDSRSQVQDMLKDASEMVAFFADNEVVTNGGFQTTVALRLALLLELLHLHQLLGESEATLRAVRANIRRQARTAKVDLESWRASYRPVNDKSTLRVSIPCTNSSPDGKCVKSTRERTAVVCMDLSSPGLKKPKAFCDRKTCSSRRKRKVARRLHMKRCVEAFEKEFKGKIKTHVRGVALKEWRDLNEEAVFGKGFRQFLKDLAKVESLNLVDVSLPGAGATPKPPKAPVPSPSTPPPGEPDGPVAGSPVDASFCCKKDEECCNGGCVPKENPLASSGLQRVCLNKRGCCPPPPPSDECASNCCQPGLDCVCGKCSVFNGFPVLCAADSGSCCTDPDNRCATDV